MDITQRLSQLEQSGNLRSIPAADSAEGIIDLSSNDYLGFAQDAQLLKQLWAAGAEAMQPVSASASRLLAGCQEPFARLEAMLEQLYGREALLFNSGYHANVGIVSALANRDTLVLADKLVHASIIDGVVLSRADCVRFRHNDYDHLQQLLAAKGPAYKHVLIVAESVYSMDGDRADIDRLAQAKHLHPGAMLYVDEAHAFGVEGPQGLGLVQASASAGADDVDVVVVTFGKGLGSVGAAALTHAPMRAYLLNTARSFIFSTALPPACVEWTCMLLERMVKAEAERRRLKILVADLADMLASAFGIANPAPSHIQPLIVGSAQKALDYSRALLQKGVKVLPIRTPTVPAGTERLRFSLSAALTDTEMRQVREALNSLSKL